MQHEMQHKNRKCLKIGTFRLRATGLEPARRRHQNLNLARLPIPPYPHIPYLSFEEKKVQTQLGFELPVKHRGFEPRTT